MYNYHLQDDELMHYGVLGMKWGRRKGASSNSKYKKYDPDIEKAMTNYKKVVKNGGSLNARKSAVADLKYAENLKKDAIILDKINSKPKSKRRLASEKKFKDMGLNDKEASIEAYKKERTQKILLGVGAVAVTSLVAYSAYKNHDYKTDRILKSGETFQNISRESNKGVEAAFYASHNSSDNKKYKGLYGKSLKEDMFGRNVYNVYNTKITAKKDIKIASHKTIRDTINDAIGKDPKFKEDLQKALKEQMNSKGIRELNEGKISKKTMDKININFVAHTPDTQKSNNNIYKLLKEKGYDALQDVNDKKVSGYRTKDPLVIFNGKEKLEVSNIKKMVNKDIDKDEMVQRAMLIGKSYVRSYAKGALATAGLVGAKTEIDRQKNTKIVAEYRKEHPKSKLTVNEIVRNNSKQYPKSKLTANEIIMNNKEKVQ